MRYNWSDDDDGPPPSNTYTLYPKEGRALRTLSWGGASHVRGLQWNPWYVSVAQAVRLQREGYDTLELLLEDTDECMATELADMIDHGRITRDGSGRLYYWWPRQRYEAVYAGTQIYDETPAWEDEGMGW